MPCRLSAEQEGRRPQQDSARCGRVCAAITSSGTVDDSDRRNAEAKIRCARGGCGHGSTPFVHDDAWSGKTEHARSHQFHAWRLPDAGTDAERIFKADPAKCRRRSLAPARKESIREAFYCNREPVRLLEIAQVTGNSSVESGRSEIAISAPIIPGTGAAASMALTRATRPGSRSYRVGASSFGNISAITAAGPVAAVRWARWKRHWTCSGLSASARVSAKTTPSIISGYIRCSANSR